MAGGLTLFLAGFLAVWIPRRQAHRVRRQMAWSAARMAIETAAISRDAAPIPVPEAEQLLARAELVATHHGGPAAADSATDLARRADQLWRATTDG